MVSGFLTSPWLQLRIWSGEAMVRRIASKREKFSDPWGFFLDDSFFFSAKSVVMSLPPLGGRFFFFHGALALAGGVRFLGLGRGQELHVHAQRLQLAHEDPERLGHPRLGVDLAADDGLVHLGAALDVVGLDREE